MSVNRGRYPLGDAYPDDVMGGGATEVRLRRGGTAAAGTDARPLWSDPSGRGWTFEPKLDGFRCLVCTHDGFRARSRRGWDMTPLLPKLAAALPADVQLDGELVALDETGRSDFHRLSSRMLQGRPGITVTFSVFDVLAVEGLSMTMQPYLERRAVLEQLELETEWVRLVATFEDGEALFEAVCERGLAGVVAKGERDPYRPGERVWVKTKNRTTARFAEERDGLAAGRVPPPAEGDKKHSVKVLGLIYLGCVAPRWR